MQSTDAQRLREALAEPDAVGWGRDADKSILAMLLTSRPPGARFPRQARPSARAPAPPPPGREGSGSPSCVGAQPSAKRARTGGEARASCGPGKLTRAAAALPVNNTALRPRRSSLGQQTSSGRATGSSSGGWSGRRIVHRCAAQPPPAAAPLAAPEAGQAPSGSGAEGPGAALEAQESVTQLLALEGLPSPTLLATAAAAGLDVGPELRPAPSHAAEAPPAEAPPGPDTAEARGSFGPSELDALMACGGGDLAAAPREQGGEDSAAAAGPSAGQLTVAPEPREASASMPVWLLMRLLQEAGLIPPAENAARRARAGKLRELAAALPAALRQLADMEEGGSLPEPAGEECLKEGWRLQEKVAQQKALSESRQALSECLHQALRGQLAVPQPAAAHALSTAALPALQLPPRLPQPLLPCQQQQAHPPSHAPLLRAQPGDAMPVTVVEALRDLLTVPHGLLLRPVAGASGASTAQAHGAAGCSGPDAGAVLLAPPGGGGQATELLARTAVPALAGQLAAAPRGVAAPLSSRPRTTGASSAQAAAAPLGSAALAIVEAPVGLLQPLGMQFPTMPLVGGGDRPAPSGPERKRSAQAAGLPELPPAAAPALRGARTSGPHTALQRLVASPAHMSGTKVTARSSQLGGGSAVSTAQGRGAEAAAAGDGLRRGQRERPSSHILREASSDPGSGRAAAAARHALSPAGQARHAAAPSGPRLVWGEQPLRPQRAQLPCEPSVTAAPLEDKPDSKFEFPAFPQRLYTQVRSVGPVPQGLALQLDCAPLGPSSVAHAQPSAARATFGSPLTRSACCACRAVASGSRPKATRSRTWAWCRACSSLRGVQPTAAAAAGARGCSLRAWTATVAGDSR
jgi:hypothetical protein